MTHLIDRLQIAQGNNNVDELIPEAIEMLRQQQAEIEALKKELETCKTIVALSNIAWKNKFGDDK